MTVDGDFHDTEFRAEMPERLQVHLSSFFSDSRCILDFDEHGLPRNSLWTDPLKSLFSKTPAML